MSQMAMYDELKCPEEQTTIASIETTTVEVASTTTEESHPEVIIKNPQKMLEDVFNEVETNIEVDSNRLDLADARKELDMMVGDQPDADEAVEDKKTLLKLPEKKEVFPKKSKNAGKKSKQTTPMDDEPMMGDAPAEEAHDNEPSVTAAPKLEGSTTDRQRREVMETTLPVDAKASNESPSNTPSSEATTEESSTISTELTTEAQQVTSVITEETTTKFIVQGHPLFHSQVVFKEPISTDTNSSLERKDVVNTDDHFIPPMLLVKARFTATKSTEGATEETKEMTTDVSTSMIPESTSEAQTVTDASFDDDKNFTSKPTETNDISTNEIASVTQLETTPELALNDRPILIEKRNDPRLGLSVLAATAQASMSPSTTVEPSSTTEDSTTVTEEISSSVSYESSTESSTTEAQTETSETSESSSVEASSTRMFDTSTSIQPEPSAERLIKSTTEKAETATSHLAKHLASSHVTPIAIRMTTLKAPGLRNDIDGGHNSEEDDSAMMTHLENNLNNEENFQPYKPNRHRAITHPDHHHGPGFSIGKILG